MAVKKILILSVSAGAGHVRAADAIKAYAEQHNTDVEATHLDVMDFVPTSFRKMYTDFYIKLVNKVPALWGYLYQASNDAKPDSNTEKMRRGVERLSTVALRKAITSFSPDAIICTHFLPAEILSRVIRQERLDCPVWVQVTDFDLHRLWVQEHIAGYFVASDEVAYRMHAAGVPAEKIQVTGIPIMPIFSQSLRRSECAEDIGLNANTKTLLLMGGGAGLGDLQHIAADLLALRTDFQLIVLAGKNTNALAELKNLETHYPDRLVSIGFTSEVERLMACSDVVITKPGGLTTSECLAMSLPMIVNSPIPGQEERNADYLLEQGVALKAFDSVTLAYRVHFLLDNPEVLNQMKVQARALGQPAAGQDVIASVCAAITLELDEKSTENNTTRHPDWARPVKPVLNLYQILPTFFRSEKIAKKDVDVLKEIGVKTVVSLRAFHKDDHYLEGSEINIKRIKIYTWRIRDKEVITALRTIKDAEQIGPVLLHCQHGADRTGLIAAMYRMVFQNWQKQHAVEELKNGGYGYHAMWRNILKYIDRVDIEHIRQQIKAE